MTEEPTTPEQAADAYSLPNLQNWSLAQVYDYAKQINDYETLSDLGNAINVARIALFRLTDRINKYERQERAAKVKYDRAYRRAYLGSSEKTEAQKRLRAELACEHLENAYIEAEQLRIELNRAANSLRLELQTLQAIGNNLRQQMKME